MKAYESTVLTEADAGTVWAVLVDAARWPTWDSGVTQVDGVIAVGARLKVTVAANPGRAFPVKVTHLQLGQSMTWSGGMPLIWRSMPDLQPSFDQFTRGLKQQAEQIAAGRP